MALTALNKETYDEAVADKSLPILVDFWGPQCVPCLGLLPVVEEMSDEYEGRVRFCKVNTAENKRLCLRLKVIGLPTFLFYKDGEPAGRLTGEFGRQEIEEILESLL
jgi:thioredoxin 1